MVSSTYSIPVRNIIGQMARGDQTLSNQAICDMALAHNDRTLFRTLVEAHCVQVKEDASKQWTYVVEPGDRFCQLFRQTFQAEIQTVRSKLIEIKKCQTFLLKAGEEKEIALAQFAQEKKLVKTHRAIQNFNDGVAVELFKQLYQSQRRSIFGQMHGRVERNQIGSFSEIEDYACANLSYMESKSRSILRQHRSQFEQILFSPLFMGFRVVSKDQIIIKPHATFQIEDEAQAYDLWYRTRSIKPKTDDRFIAKFSEAYAKHVKKRAFPVLIDKMRKWLGNNEIFSHKQLTSFAQANPNSEVARILNTKLKGKLDRVLETKQEFLDLTINSKTFLNLTSGHPEFLKRSNVSYTPPKKDETDPIEPFDLHPLNEISDLESSLYEFYMERQFN